MSDSVIILSIHSHDYRYQTFKSFGFQNSITEFQEKPDGDGSFINGGFFVLSPEVIKYIENEKTLWEQEPLKNLAKDGQLMAYKHEGFWQPMDTLRDKTHLEDLWQSGKAPWKVW